GLVSRVVDEPYAVADELAGNDHAAVRAVKARLRDDADRETREREEADAFAELAVERAGTRNEDSRGREEN
ncbi:enoyl-CoA hydratase/isomerase family protein, partial [Natronoarchaeum mannanilyticum]